MSPTVVINFIDCSLNKQYGNYEFARAEYCLDLQVSKQILADQQSSISQGELLLRVFAR